MLFDGPPAELPIATISTPGPIRPAGTARLPPIWGHQLWLGDLDRWLTERYRWIAARTIPLIVAVVSLFAILGAVKYAGLYARTSQLSLGVHARVADTAPAEATARHGRVQPTMIVVRPLSPHDHYVVLTIDPPDAP